MAKSVINTELDVNNTIETLVYVHEDLHKDYLTKSKLFDFVPGDFVKCTYLSGYFKVLSFDDNKVIIRYLDGSCEQKVRPDFLNKVNLDENWVNTLYRKKKT